MKPIHNTIDLLEEKLAVASSSGNERIDILNSLSWELWTTDPDRATAIFKEADELLAKEDYPRGRAYATLNRGIFIWRSDAVSSLPLFEEALDWFEANNDFGGAANTYNFMAIIFWAMGDLQRGLDNSMKALSFHEQIDEPDGLGWVFQTLSGFHYDLKQYEQSKAYALRASELFRKTGNEIGEVRAMNSIANALLYLGESSLALEYLQECLKNVRSIGHALSESRVLNDTGIVYQQKGDYRKALEFHLEGLRLREELDYPTGQTTSLMDIGRAYAQLGESDKALAAIDESLRLSEQIKARPKQARAHLEFAAIYEGLGNYQQALHHQKMASQLEASIFTEDAERKMDNIRSIYEKETARKESEIFRLRNVELKEKNEQLEHMIQELHATQAQLVQSGKMAALGNLVAGIAHEMNTPIGAIKSGADLSQRIADKLLRTVNGADLPETIAKELDKTLPLLSSTTLNTTAAVDRIMKLVAGLKNFSRLDEAEFQLADLHEGLESTLLLISHEIPANVQIHRQFATLPKVHCFPNELNQVFMNLLLNALQAMKNGGKLTIQTSIDKQHICVLFRDTGSGIATDKLEKLFEPGFSSGNGRMKMKTGLYTSLNILDKHRGRIDVRSKPGSGTTFTLIIPTNLQDYMSPLSHQSSGKSAQSAQSV